MEMEKANSAHGHPTWFLLAVAILFGGLLMASLRTGKIVFPFLGLIKRAEHPVSYWTVPAPPRLVLALCPLALFTAQLPINVGSSRQPRRGRGRLSPDAAAPSVPSTCR